jgi:transcriptional antiterminator NusG
MDLNDDTWHLVKETPRVMGFIGGKADQPAPLSPREAASILDRVAAGSEKATPKTVFEPGEIVRVTDGPFNDFNGVVEEVNYEKSRLQVAGNYIRPFNPCGVGLWPGRKRLITQFLMS